MDPYAARRRAEEENLAEYERLAKAEEVAVLAEAPAILARMVAEHERDVAAYSFECRRFGDFLTVFIERGEASWKSEWEVEKFSTSINLGRTNTIQMQDGNVPDECGRVVYRTGLLAKDGSGGASVWPGPPIPDENWVRDVTPDWDPDRHRKARRGFVTIVDPKEGQVIYGGDSIARHVTPNFPRAAADDRIHFHGADIAINVPAGLGKSVLEKVMAAIAAGAPDVAAPKLSA